MRLTRRGQLIANWTGNVALLALVAAGAWAFVHGVDTDPDLNPTPRHALRDTSTIEEDEPGWNCLTMGNRTCGPNWTTVTTRTGALAGIPTTTACVTDAVIVVCADGQVIRP